MDKIIVNFGGGVLLAPHRIRKEASVRFSLSPQTSERRSEVELIVGGDSYGC